MSFHVHVALVIIDCIERRSIYLHFIHNKHWRKRTQTQFIECSECNGILNYAIYDGISQIVVYFCFLSTCILSLVEERIFSSLTQFTINQRQYTANECGWVCCVRWHSTWAELLECIRFKPTIHYIAMQRHFQIIVR